MNQRKEIVIILIFTNVLFRFILFHGVPWNNFQSKGRNISSFIEPPKETDLIETDPEIGEA